MLIFKASGVFNFAQGAMVLFAALSMARLSEWIPGWLGIQNLWLANGLAFAASVAIMIVLAMVIERIVLRPLVNQDGVVLLMFQAAGIALVAFGRYHLDFSGQTFVIFVLTVAAAEAAMALALVVLLFRRRDSLDAEAWADMKG